MIRVLMISLMSLSLGLFGCAEKESATTTTTANAPEKAEAAVKEETAKKTPVTPSKEAVAAARARAKENAHNHDHHGHDHHGHDHHGHDHAGHGAPAKPAGIPAPTDVAAAPADAEKTKSGLASKLLKKGTGTDHPSASSSVSVHYTGWTTDGKMFDSSVKRGTPATFRLNGVIPGWTEGLQLMVAGEKRRFWIPEELAYKGRKGPPAGMLVFDVELLEITKSPEAPSDVAAAPADAEKTASGLMSKVIKAGTGKVHPKAENKVTVHYSGWTTDGKMFDSSVMRKQPATFPLNRVIPGWTEGVQLMVIGETRRLWIPEELAYKGRPGAPAGMLVFDVELISIQ
jgi:peptidylprolyl isomerase